GRARARRNALRGLDRDGAVSIQAGWARLRGARHRLRAGIDGGRSMRTGDPRKVKVESVERFERDVKLRLPFRFGVVTVTEATQAVVRVTVSTPNGRSATGIAAETLAPKWFDKNLALSDDDNVQQLRQALDIAVDLYSGRKSTTPYALYADTYREQLARCAALELNPLVANFGPALLDRAIIDALGRILGLSFTDIMRANL